MIDKLNFHVLAELIMQKAEHDPAFAKIAGVSVLSVPSPKIIASKPKSVTILEEQVEA